MARMIDADKIKQQLRYLVSTCERVGDHSAADNFRDCIVLVDNQPTLSQDAGTVLATDERVVITAPASSVTADGPAITHWMPLPEPPGKGE